VAELSLLLVDPAARRQGHGSRLLAAAADVSAAGGVRELVAWLPASDDAARRFLADTGWAVDGAHRSVEVEGLDGTVRVVRELRYATRLDAS
jgi:GNAT superfamily N-acetyltransferase